MFAELQIIQCITDSHSKDEMRSVRRPFKDENQDPQNIAKRSLYNLNFNCKFEKIAVRMKRTKLWYK